MSSVIIEPGLPLEATLVHRALASLQEELEAIDNYHQRVEVTANETLKAVLAHNRDDEMEHAALLLEWLRRSMPELDLQLRKYLFQPIDLVPAPEGEDAVATGVGLGFGAFK